MSTRHSASSEQQPRVLDASMTLLNEVYRRPLDPGYAQAAAAREPGRRRRPRAVAGLLVLGLVLGLGTVTATIALRRPAGSVAEARQLLESQILQRGEEAADRQDEVTSLSAEIAHLQSQVLGDAQAGLADELAAGAVASGVVAVTGPGLKIVLSDAPTDDPDHEDPDLRVRDVDLQVVVNGLWAAGAEAIAINGQRLTAMTAIRAAGSAVLVDLVPLASPYTVQAIGDAVHMQTELARTTAGQYMATLRTSYGIGVKTSSEHELKLPGTGQVTLYSASVPEREAPKASPSPTPETSGTADAGASGRATGSAPEGAGVAGSAGRREEGM